MLYGCSPWKTASSVKSSATCSGWWPSIARCQASSRFGRTVMSVPRALAAVDVQDLAGDERGVLEEDDGVGDVADRAEPADRVQAGQELVGLGRVHGGGDDAGRDRVEADAAGRVLDGQGLGRRVEAALGERGERRRQAAV